MENFFLTWYLLHGLRWAAVLGMLFSGVILVFPNIDLPTLRDHIISFEVLAVSGAIVLIVAEAGIVAFQIERNTARIARALERAAKADAYVPGVYAAAARDLD